MNYMDSSPFKRGPMGMRNRRPAERPTFKGGPFPKDSPPPTFGPGKPFPKGQDITYTPMTAGVDFGNRRPMYDRNGKLIQQRPVLKDSRTVPVPIMDYTGSMTAQAYKPGYPTEMDYLSDPFREIDPASLYFPENPSDNMNDPLDDDMYQGYGQGPLYFG
jgi:hypothetical protein